MHLLRFILLFALLPILKANKVSHSFDVEYEATTNGEVIHALVKRVEVLEARDKKQTQIIEALERGHKQEMDKLKQELANQKDEIAAIRKEGTGQYRLLFKLMRRMKLRGRTLVTGPEEAKDESKQTPSKVNRIRRAENEVTVAFDAGLTHRVLHAGVHQNIVFDHVETNKGNGYNPHHGVFTAPVSGLYVFYTSILADNNREVYCQIVVNGSNKAMVYARGTDNRHDQGSQALVIQLQKGDDISVQNLVADDAIYGDGSGYSTFSGFLLQQDFSQAGTVVG